MRRPDYWNQAPVSELLRREPHAAIYLGNYSVYLTQTLEGTPVQVAAQVKDHVQGEAEAMLRVIGEPEQPVTDPIDAILADLR